jgi:hypothetical protein
MFQPRVGHVIKRSGRIAENSRYPRYKMGPYPLDEYEEWQVDLSHLEDRHKYVQVVRDDMETESVIELRTPLPLAPVATSNSPRRTKTVSKKSSPPPPVLWNPTTTWNPVHSPDRDEDVWSVITLA